VKCPGRSAATGDLTGGAADGVGSGLSTRLSNAVSRMSPRLRRNWGVSRGILSTSVYLASCCTPERIDELACIAALLAKLRPENSSSVSSPELI